MLDPSGDDQKRGVGRGEEAGVRQFAAIRIALCALYASILVVVVVVVIVGVFLSCSRWRRLLRCTDSELGLEEMGRQERNRRPSIR